MVSVNVDLERCGVFWEVDFGCRGVVGLGVNKRVNGHVFGLRVEEESESG